MSSDDPYAIDDFELNFFNTQIKPNIKDEVENFISLDGRVSLDNENVNLKHGNISLLEGNISLKSGNISLIDGSISLDNENILLKSGNISLNRGNINLLQGQLYVQSDERLKTDIRPIENALDRIGKLKGVYYHWKDDKKDKQEIGVIAQDVQQQFPELVNTDKNGILSVDYIKLTAILIECVKDLKQQISHKS
jgi:hypothetical protein